MPSSTEFVSPKYFGKVTRMQDLSDARFGVRAYGVLPRLLSTFSFTQRYFRCIKALPGTIMLFSIWFGKEGLSEMSKPLKRLQVL